MRSMKSAAILMVPASLVMALSLAVARAPSSTDVMQPVDMTAGTMSDPNKLLQVSLDRPVQLSISSAPAEIAFMELGNLMGIQWGFMPGVDLTRKVTLTQGGPGRDLLKALGEAAQVRYEVSGPTQMRVFPARAKPAPKRTTPPPVKHD